MDATDRRALTIMLKGKVRLGAEAVNEFAEAMRKDPMHTLIWADGVAASIADAKVAADALTAFEGVNLKHAQEWARKEALRYTRNQANISTSPFRNAMDRLVGVAWAEMLETLEDWKEDP